VSFFVSVVDAVFMAGSQKQPSGGQQLSSLICILPLLIIPQEIWFSFGGGVSSTMSSTQYYAQAKMDVNMNLFAKDVNRGTDLFVHFNSIKTKLE
jgi:hypothetical protein